MTHHADLPSNELAKKCSTDKKKKPFEPPMNTDEHRLKADKEKYIIKNELDNRQHSARIWCVASQAMAVVGTNPSLLSRKTWYETVGSSFALREADLRLIGNQGDKLFVFIMSLSVLIGVNRWLKILCFNLLNQDLSMCAFAGACDASVAW